MSRTVLVEVDVVSPAGATSTLRYANRATRPFPPGDSLRANLPWDDRLVTAPRLRRALFDDLNELTPGFGFGAMILANGDRALDTYRTYAWGELRVYLWSAGAFSTATRVMTGLCGSPTFPAPGKEAARVTLPLYDYSAELDNARNFGLYDGDNDNVIKFWEGDASLKGQTNPRAYGRMMQAHLPGVLVNAARLGFQVSEFGCNQIEWLYDGGEPGAIFGGDYSDATFDASSPPPGYFWSDNNRGLLQANIAPVRRLTFGCFGTDLPSYIEEPGDIADRLLRNASVPTGRIGASIAAHTDPSVLGLYIVSGDSTREAISTAARSGRAVVLPDRNGVYQLIPFGPAGSPVETITADQVIDIEVDQNVPGPVGEVRVGFDRIYTVFRPEDLAPAIRGTDEEVRLTNEYRWAVSESATTKARFPRTWRSLTVRTACQERDDADNLLSILLDMFGVRADGAPRRAYRVTLELTEARLAREVGQTIHLTDPDAGLNDDLILLAEELFSPRDDRVIWTLWG